MTTTQEVMRCSKCGYQAVVRGGLRPNCCPFCGACEIDGYIWFDTENKPESGEDLRRELPSKYTA